MSLQDWGSLGELIGAVATVLTLAYLAVQVRQNSLQMREATRVANTRAMDNTVEAFSRYRAMLVVPEYAELYLRGLESYKTLSEVDQVRFKSIMEEYLFAYNAMFERLKAETYDWGTWQAQLAGAIKALASPGAADWWAERKHIYGAEFVAEVDSHLIKIDTT